ncbi:MAG: hypothetical protein KAX20_02370 [Candidatus Omnitrophica bacterium]|nr:hypothetical protein [Candidatus Omnitrophota bacterium]
MEEKLKNVKKRDGRIVPFDKNKITEAIFKAAKAVGGEDRYLAEDLADSVTFYLQKQFVNKIPAVEEIQDIVEKVLIKTGHAKTAKAYILYREKRARIRKIKKGIILGELEEELASGGFTGLFLLIGRSEDEVLLWERGKVVDALVKEKGLSRNIAELIGLEVEDQILNSKMKALSTSSIEELINNKVAEYSQRR